MALNARLSSGTSTGTFAVSPGPYRNYHAKAGTAHSVEDETQNGRRNAKRNPNRNHETIFLSLFSPENLKRDLKR